MQPRLEIRIYFGLIFKSAWWAEGAAWRPGCTWRAACWQVASPSCPSPPSGALPLDQLGKTQLCREELQSYVPPEAN